MTVEKPNKGIAFGEPANYVRTSHSEKEAIL